MKFIQEFKLFEAWVEYQENGETIYSTRGQEGQPVPGGARYFDPYEYCIRNDQWFARKRPSRNNSKNIPWFQISTARLTPEQICKSLTILDTQFPQARSKAAQDADKNKFCNITVTPKPDDNNQKQKTDDTTGGTDKVPAPQPGPVTVDKGYYFHDDYQMQLFTRFCIIMTNILAMTDKYDKGNPLIADCKTSFFSLEGDDVIKATKKINVFFLGSECVNPKTNELDFDKVQINDETTQYPWETPGMVDLIRNLEKSNPNIQTWIKSEIYQKYFPKSVKKDYWTNFLVQYQELLRKIRIKDNDYFFRLPPFYGLWAKQFYKNKPQELAVINKYLKVESPKGTELKFSDTDFIKKVMACKDSDKIYDYWKFSTDTDNSPDF